MAQECTADNKNSTSSNRIFILILLTVGRFSFLALSSVSHLDKCEMIRLTSGIVPRDTYTSATSATPVSMLDKGSRPGDECLRKQKLIIGRRTGGPEGTTKSVDGKHLDGNGLPIL